MWKPPGLYGRYSYYYFFLLILFIHLGVILVKFYPKIIKSEDSDRPLKVHLAPDKSRTKKQIVQSEDTDDKNLKENAYLSDKDRSFDRESKARQTAPFKSGAKTKGGAPPVKTAKDLKLSDLGAKEGKENPLKDAAERYTKAQKSHGDNSSTEEAVSSTNDHLEEVPLGDFTHLNTVEYKYYGFYHRVRQKLEQFWGRSIHEKAQELLKMGRQVASSEEFVTSLQVTLDHEGEIVEIKLMGTSGIKELDDAAVESFNEAGPFPNPPKGLVKNGRVVLEWGFVVST